MFGKLPKSLLFMVMTIIMALALVACGPAAAPAEAPAEEAETEAESAAPAEEEVEAEAEPEEAMEEEAEPEEAMEEEAEAEPEEAMEEEASTGDIPSSETLTIAWVPTDPASLDPHVCPSTDCRTLVRVLYEALVAYEYGGTDVEGVIAEEWEVSDDGLEWTFKLRDGVHFSDGSEITAEDVAYSFDRLDGIGKGPSFVVSGNYGGAEIIDDKTVKLKLIEPVGPFETMLPWAFIVNSDVVKENATDDDPWAEEWMYDHIAGSGAFVLENWDHGVEVSLVANENYWDPEWPKIKRFVMQLIPEMSTQRLMLEEGDIDMIVIPNHEDLAAYEANPDIEVAEEESFTTMQIMLNQIKPPLDDIRVREAMAYAFDYQAMIDGVYLGRAVQARGPVPGNIPFHDDSLPMYEQDLEKAKALIEEAGYAPGDINLEMMIVQGSNRQVGSAQILQQALAEIGVNLQISELSWATMLGRIQSREDSADMFNFFTFPRYPDPDAALWSTFHTSQQETGYNGIWYGDQETDALLETGRFGVDTAEREEAYKQIQQRLVEDHAAIWLLNSTEVNVYRSWVKNYKYDPTWNQTIRADRIWLEGKP